MKKLVLAALLAASAIPAYASAVFQFTGSDQDGAAVSGTLTIDTDLLAAANSATPPALDYYFATGDAASTVAGSFLTLDFASAGTSPSLLNAGDVTYQSLHADPADHSLALELDWQRANTDGSLTSSRVTLSSFTLTDTGPNGGALLPDFAGAGPVYFDVQSGTGPTETYDVESFGALTFTGAAALPEASTWAALVLGFGAIGASLRRRRPQALTV